MQKEQAPAKKLPTLISHHWGASIKYNLESVSRLKYANNSVVQLWFPDKDDNIPLVVRLKQGAGYPWMVGHRGYDEIFRSSLVVPAVVNSRTQDCVHIYMSTHTRRKGDPITRQFRIRFDTRLEAESFVFTHNLFLERCRDFESELEDSSDEEESEDEDKKKEEALAKEKAQKEEDRKRKYDSTGQTRYDSDEGYNSEEAMAFLGTQDPFADYLSD
jgi:hypothetical protein